MCMYMFVCVLMHVYVRGNFKCHLQELHPLLEIVYPIDLELTSKDGQVDQQAPEIFLSPLLQRWCYRSMSYVQHFLWVWGLNSDLCTCKASPFSLSYHHSFIFLPLILFLCVFFLNKEPQDVQTEPIYNVYRNIIYSKSTNILICEFLVRRKRDVRGQGP